MNYNLLFNFVNPLFIIKIRTSYKSTAKCYVTSNVLSTSDNICIHELNIFKENKPALQRRRQDFTSKRLYPSNY